MIWVGGRGGYQFSSDGDGKARVVMAVVLVPPTELLMASWFPSLYMILVVPVPPTGMLVALSLWGRGRVVVVPVWFELRF